MSRTLVLLAVALLTAGCAGVPVTDDASTVATATPTPTRATTQPPTQTATQTSAQTPTRTPAGTPTQTSAQTPTQTLTATETASAGGYVAAKVVDSVPDDATLVNATNATVRNISLVQTAIDRALRDGHANVYFPDGRGRKIADALPSIAASEEPFGYYLRAEGKIVRVRVVYYV